MAATRATPIERVQTPAHPPFPALHAQAAAAGGAGAQRDLGSARMHLRGLIKQAQDRYEEELEFKQLQALLAEVEAAQATLAAAAAGQ